VEHSVLAGYVTPLSRALGGGSLAHMLSPTSPFGAQAIDAMVNRQAQIIAYNDDFKLMMLTTLPMLLLLPLLRRPSGPSEGHTAVME
jgi:MFS transporter, DHA2 family, multidrug resistance protein